MIATEKEHAKAVKARLHWKEAGDEVEPWIELREGNLLETLKVDEGMPERIDLLLLDVWTPLALPTLKFVQPRLKYTTQKRKCQGIFALLNCEVCAHVTTQNPGETARHDEQNSIYQSHTSP
ncbi:hypothetical protein RBB50_012728 [Rhinocladiella similis]